MKETPSEKRLQSVVSVTLRSGVLFASVIGIVGGLLFLATYGSETVNFSSFDGTASPYVSLSSISRALGAGGQVEYLAVVQIGVIVLLLTPIVRVALSIVGFTLAGDKTYVAITTVVLLTLIASIALH